MDDTRLRDGKGRRTRVAAIVNVLVAFGCLWLCLVTSGPIRWPAGVLLVLVLPGDAVRRWLRSDTLVESAVVTVAGSLTTTIVIGLAANAVGAGVTPTAMAVGLAVTTALVDVAALAGAALGPDAAARWDAAGAAAGAAGAGRRHGRLVVGFAVPALAFGLLTTQAVAIAARSEQRADTAQTVLSLAASRHGLDVTVDTPVTRTYDLVVSAPHRTLLRTRLAMRAGQHRTLTVAASPVAAGSRITATLRDSGDGRRLRTAWVSAPGNLRAGR